MTSGDASAWKDAHPRARSVPSRRAAADAWDPPAASDGSASIATRASRFWARVLRILLPAVLLIALVPLGSTGIYAMPIAMLAAAAWCVGTVPVAGRMRWPVAAALLVALLMAAYMLAQITPGLEGLTPHPIWAEASALLRRNLPATVSVAPSRTLSALPPVVMPFLIFSGVIVLYRSDRQAIALLRFLGFAGVAVALFGIGQHFLFPDTLLVFPKTSYRDSLTAVFVNRNSAATFFGCTVLLLLALIARRLRGRPTLRSIVVLAIEPGRARRELMLVVEIAALFLATLALFLTKSRAGIASTAGATLLLVILLPAGVGEGRVRRRRRSFVIRRRLTALAGGLLCLLMVLWLFGGQALYRVTRDGVDDPRFCVLPGMWRAAQEVWPFGSGAGTFDLVFPAYRDPACGIYWVWDRAHNFYLEGLVTMGVAFVAAALAVYVGLAALLLRGLRRRKRERFAPAMGLAVILLLTLHDSVDFSLQIPGIALWSAAILGATGAMALRGGVSDGRAQYSSNLS